MSVFQTYFLLGFHHIMSWRATDHLAFLLALCAPYVLADWRRVGALATSFTVGHSLTLALATLGQLSFPAALIEALIPVTVMLTALFNLARAGKPWARHLGGQGGGREWPGAAYALAAAFGLVHGLGFANYLRALLGAGRRPVVELLAFNVGVELGQLLVVGLILALALGLLRGLGVAHRDWVLTCSGAALGIALLLLMQLITA
ncbi:HupE/UreJ family protein [uncultured Hymenobacter sp.]|uniref:HupE/UreJ family protein n=1 Tax=uncultured Hymenobacter sp. TaxID=170016 RepID=UPI0035CB8415